METRRLGSVDVSLSSFRNRSLEKLLLAWFSLACFKFRIGLVDDEGNATAANLLAVLMP